MIKLQALENFTLERFNEVQDIERAGKDQKNWINKNDVFKCGKGLADYLLGDNPLKRPVVKVIEVEPEFTKDPITKEIKIEEVKQIQEIKPTKKKKSSKK